MSPETADPSVERFARVTPPDGHETRVRARSGPVAEARTVETAPPLGGAWRWVLPVAASVLVAAGAVWQSNRASSHVPLAPPQASSEWGGKGVDMPVLPPRAYWEMSAFEEFERLRGGRVVDAEIPSSVRPVRAAPRTVAAVAYHTSGRETPWTSLPPIQLDDIAPAPLEVPAISGLEPLELEPIRIEPIDTVPVDKEQE